MNVTPPGNSTGVASGYPVQGAGQPAVDAGTNATGETRPHHAHGHGGGHMQKELTSALESPGLSVPAGASSRSSTSSSTATTATGSTIQTDLQGFMQQLGESIRGTRSSGPGTASADSRSGFGAGLSALISQAANGNAPSGLESAFARLSSDLRKADSSPGSTPSRSSSQPALEALLSHLRQNLGYGVTSGAQAVGNVISSQA